jgi:serine/threonine protein phosphatase PrpC
LSRIFTFSEAGGHAINEDAFMIQAHPSDPGCLLVALADGQGGQAGGGPAARLACQAALASAARLSVASFAGVGAWTTSLATADQEVCADRDAGLTTLVAFSLYKDQLVGASSGDSAALLLHGDGQTEVLTARQFKDPPVGSGGALCVPFAAKLKAPWRVLAMSDGVWKYVGWEQVAALATAAGGEKLIEALQAKARLPGSGQFQDDFTLVVVESA